MLLDEKIVAIEKALQAEAIPHAFGGAQALAYYGTVRATADIDLNLFLRIERAAPALAALARLGVRTEEPHVPSSIERDGQVRVFWERTPIDLFFSYDPLHDSAMQRRRTVAFGPDTIHVLAAEDLVIFKVIFNRAKDWRDLAELVFACERPLDAAYVLTWLRRILTPEDRRLREIQRLIESGGIQLEGDR
jgi:hypothetical protein